MRTGLAAVGVAALLVGGLNIASDAAGNAKPVLLGKSNKAKKTTKLSNKKAGPVLALKAKSGPALSVNTTDLIANLNADQLDGKTLEQVSPTIYTLTLLTPGGTTPATPVILASSSIPAGTYEASMSALFNTLAGDEVACQMIDYTKLVAAPSDLTAIQLAGNAFEDNPTVDDQRIVTIVAGHQYVFLCTGSSGVEVAQPAVFRLQAVDRIAQIPGQAPFTPRPGTLKGLQALR